MEFSPVIPKTPVRQSVIGAVAIPTLVAMSLGSLAGSASAARSAWR